MQGERLLRIKTQYRDLEINEHEYKKELAITQTRVACLVPPERQAVVQLGDNVGVLFLPDSLGQQGVARDRAIWLIPSSKFQKDVWSQRKEWIDEVSAHYNDPDQAWNAWMNRDATVAAHIGENASHLDYSWIIVDGTKTIEQLADIVERHFQLA